FHRQDWGDFKKNTTIEGNLFTVAGKRYEEGFGTHAASTTIFLLDKAYTKFTSLIGLDDESLCSDGVQIQVEGDDRLLYKSPTVTSQNLISIEVPLTGVKKLTLKTLPLATNNCDHVNFIYPTLH
ncbi:MAG TPA: glycosyl hydrolase family 98, partial [Fibrobacter sp.]|nr:glycosyl hydrolase family 98 [Fibrobacter sp.]